MKSTLNRFVLGALLLLGFSNCGGGTTGTDLGGSTRVLGKLVSSEDIPISDASISVAETGQTTITDAAGEFEVESSVQSPELTFIVEASGLTAQATISELPPEPLDIAVDLRLDNNLGQLSVQSSEVRPRRRPTPTPTPRSREPRTPTPTATPVVPRATLPLVLNVEGLGEFLATASIYQKPRVANFVGDANLASSELALSKGRYFSSVLFRTGLGHSGTIQFTGSLDEIDRITLNCELLRSRHGSLKLKLLSMVTEPDVAQPPAISLPNVLTTPTPTPDATPTPEG